MNQEKNKDKNKGIDIISLNGKKLGELNNSDLNTFEYYLKNIVLEKLGVEIISFDVNIEKNGYHYQFTFNYYNHVFYSNFSSDTKMDYLLSKNESFIRSIYLYLKDLIVPTK